MRSSALFFSYAVACLAALPTVAAAPENLTGRIAAQGITAEGDNDLGGLLLALYRLDVDGAGGDVSFDLQAGQVEVHTYSSDPAVSAGQGWVAPIPPGYEPEMRAFADAEIVSSGQTKPGYKFSLVAAHGAHLEVKSACAGFDEPDRNRFEAPPVVGLPAEPVAADVSSAVHWTACGSSDVIVIGDMTVVLWQVDAVLTAGNDTMELRSGFDKSSLLPDPVAGLAQGTLSHMRQQYLYVHGGRMSFTMDASPHHAFVQTPSVQTAGRLTFLDAVGEVRRGAEVVPVAARHLSVEGTAIVIEPRLASQSNRPMETTVAHAASVKADGRPLLLVSSPEAGNHWTGWLIGLGFGAVLVPVPLARRIRRHRANHAAQRCKALADIARFEEARIEGETAVHLHPGHPEAHANLARALEHLGQFDEAERHRVLVNSLRSASKGDAWLWAENAFQAAEAAATANKPARALEWLRMALQDQPALLEDADCVPVLRPIVEQISTENTAETPFWLRP